MVYWLRLALKLLLFELRYKTSSEYYGFTYREVKLCTYLIFTQLKAQSH